MLVLNASGIILGDKKVNNWFEGKIEKKENFYEHQFFPHLWEIESRNNDDISCQIIWILLSLITNQAWFCLTLSLLKVFIVYTRSNKRQCLVCSGILFTLSRWSAQYFIETYIESSGQEQPAFSLSVVEYQKVESCCNQWSRIQCTSKRTWMKI